MSMKSAEPMSVPEVLSRYSLTESPIRAPVKERPALNVRVVPLMSVLLMKRG